MVEQPGSFTAALLSRLGPADEALLGDICEEHAAGRSGCWVWSQVLHALAREALRQAGTNKVLTTSAVLTVLACFEWFFSGNYLRLTHSLLHFQVTALGAPPVPAPVANHCRATRS